MICIIDYGLGNLGSIQNMIDYIDVDSQITSDPKLITDSNKFILPGVGAFDTAIKMINSKEGLYESLYEQIIVKKKPILGVCLGMQLFMNKSDEGTEKVLDGLMVKLKDFQK